MSTSRTSRTRRRPLFVVLLMALTAALTFGPSPSADAQTDELNLEVTVTEGALGGTIELDWDPVPGTDYYWVYRNADIFSPESTPANVHPDGTGFVYSSPWWFHLEGTWTVCASSCESVTVTAPQPADPAIDVTVNRLSNRYRNATVVVHDGQGNPLTNSTIIGHWENGASGSLYMALGPDGIGTTASVRVGRRANPTFVVDEVTYLDGYELVRYNP